MTSDLHAPWASALTPTNDGASGSPQTRGPRDQQAHADSGTPRGGCKAFATLRAELALHGYSLSCSSADDGPAGFYVGRWGMMRELPDLAGVVAFAEQVGVRDG